MSTEASALAATAAPRIDADNPWPGLLSFFEQDSAFFKGRDRETDELFQLVMRERLIVLFGISGLGKSSLLQAGLFPRLRPENVFPVHIRLDFSEPEPDLTTQVFGTITRAANRITDSSGKQRVEAPAALSGETLWEYFHRQGNTFWNERNRPLIPLLVFDQFEEIFTLGRQDRSRKAASAIFLEQLADLAEGRPPAKLKAWIDDHPDEAANFDFDRHYYKVLLGIREDYLPDLESLRPRMPRVAMNRLRLRRMNGEAALLVVNQARNLIDGAVAEQVVRFVAADQQSELRELQIEPALLSVFCSELNNKRNAARQEKITTELLQGSQQQVIANFYERSTSDVAPEVRTFIEDHLLTVSGFRDSVALENALGMGIGEETIKKLVDRRLVRQEDRSGSKRLELTHDLLVSVVRASRDTRHQREAAEKEKAELLAAQEKQKQELLKAQEEEHQRLEKAQEDEKRERDQQEMKRLRKRSLVAISAMVAAVVMAVFLGMAWMGANRDRIAARKAEAAAKKAELASQQAEQAEKAAKEEALRKAAENQQYAEDLINRASASAEPKNQARGGGRTAPSMRPVPALPIGHANVPDAGVNPAAVGPPRVFIQIVNQDDKAFASQLAAKFQAAGFSVQPIQYVPQASVLSRTDVRFYRKSDADMAAKVVNILKAAGQTSARAYIPGGMEDSSKVRPNTFEVWLANGAGSGAGKAAN